MSLLHLLNMFFHFIDPEKMEFPPVTEAGPDGLLAIGGDLSIPRLLKAYSEGIFPWNNPDDPILWWAPDPRFVLFPSEVRISKSMRQVFRSQRFSISCDQAFDEVMFHCQTVKRGYQPEPISWITDEMRASYAGLHTQKIAHSVEVWHDGQLAGGLYGIALGKVFFGESMFSTIANASKVALIYLCRNLAEQGFRLIDCQVETEHLISMGARLISRSDFMRVLKTDQPINIWDSGNDWRDWFNCRFEVW